MSHLNVNKFMVLNGVPLQKYSHPLPTRSGGGQRGRSRVVRRTPPLKHRLPQPAAFLSRSAPSAALAPGSASPMTPKLRYGDGAADSAPLTKSTHATVIAQERQPLRYLPFSALP